MLQFYSVILPLWLFIFIAAARATISQERLIRTVLLVNITNVIITLFLFFKFTKTGEVHFLNFGTWLKLGDLNISFSFMFDALSYVMLLVVIIISALVQIYSIGYMVHDPQFPLFMAYLALFTFSMLLFVTAGNFIVMFFGWEAVGLCSYFLINFWHTRIAANKSALKAIIVNKVGDIALLYSFAIIYYNYRTFEYPVVFLLAEKTDLYINQIAILLTVAAAAKSAQLGLHTWLPDAMEGPTPVSALIHAATMVTAGIYLLIRCSPVLEQSIVALNICVVLGATTAFFASLVAIFQNDIKRIIAYSTCSQLGYLLCICGLSAYDIALFHLFNHAFFKALLFLSAGAVIHGISDEQDIRRMGGLHKLMPLTYVTTTIGSFALMGLPFTSGFFSKDLLLEQAFATYDEYSLTGYILCLIATIFTAFYSIKLIYLVYITEPNAYKSYITNIHHTHPAMVFSLLCLSIFTIFSGYVFNDLFVGFGSSFWGNSFVSNRQFINAGDFEFLPTHLKLVPILTTLGGSLIAIDVYSRKHYNRLTTNFLLFYTYNNQKWGFDTIYNYVLVKPFLFIGEKVTFRILDRGLFEWLGPYGIVRIISFFVLANYNLSSRYLYNQIFYLWFSLIMCLSILILKHGNLTLPGLNIIELLVVTNYAYLLLKKHEQIK